MGIIKQGILGGFSGKVGSVVGTSWKGRAVMKAMPLSVANPKTTGQVNQRTKFTACVELAKALLGGSIALLDNPFAGSISGYNRFVSRNVSKFGDVGSLTHTSGLISQGVLGGCTIDPISILANGDEQLDFSFDSVDSPYNLSTDKLVAVAIRVGTNEVLYAGSVLGNRASGTGTMMLSRPVVTDESIAVHVGFVRADNKYCSTSSFKIKTVTAS